MNNLRPFISRKSIFDKITEKIKGCTIFCKCSIQKSIWFRKNNSTSCALMEITENIKESIDKGKFGCGQAFDTVNHNIPF